MKKKIFGNRLSTIVGYLRNFVRQIKIVRKGDYFLINSAQRSIVILTQGIHQEHVSQKNYMTL